MKTSALERLLVPTRVPRRATVEGDFAFPALHDRAVEAAEGPFVVTTTRGSLVQTRRRPDGTVWAGFADVPVADEGLFLRRIFEGHCKVSDQNGWMNRCSSLSEAVPLMEALGHKPRSIIVPVPLLGEACGEDVSLETAERLMATQGFVARVEDTLVLAGDLEPGTALVAAAPILCGSYTRTDDALALIFLRADQTLVLVGG